MIDFGGPKRAGDDRARQRPHHRPADLHRRHHVGGCDDLLALDAPAGSTRCWRHDRIALFQATTGIDPERTPRSWSRQLRRPRAAARRCCSRRRCRACSTGIPGARARSFATQADDPVLAACSRRGRSTGIWVHVGSLALLAEGGKLVNRGFVIDRTGEVRARYDKIHLFDVDLPTGESWRESAPIAAARARWWSTERRSGKLGLTICYDLRFPSSFARWRGRRRRDRHPRGLHRADRQAHWHMLMRARAIEAGVFVVAAAQVGHTRTAARLMAIAGRRSLGRGAARHGRRAGLGFAEIDLAAVAEVRGGARHQAPPRRSRGL